MTTSVLAATPTVEEIVKADDEIRNPGFPFSIANTLTEYRDGVARGQMVLTVFSKEDADGTPRSLARFDAPPRDIGKLSLDNAGEFWFFDPASEATMRLTAQQRLIGEASYGDVMMVNYGRDYKASLAGEEQILDGDRQQRDCWHLNLTEKTDTATYNRIEIWVDKENYRPVKSRFYSDSGRLLKTLFYRKFADALGAQRPSEIIIIDGIDTNLVTRMEISNWQRREIPDAWFHPDLLGRLRMK